MSSEDAANRVRPGSQLSVRLSLFLVALIAVFLLIGGAASADTPPAPTVEYVVAHGDTLWAIASRFTPEDGDVRVRVAEIKELSGIRSSTLIPGQILSLPG